MAGIGVSGPRFKRIPEPGGMTGQQASSVYDTFYGELKTPATQYAMSDTPLRSVDVTPSVRTIASNASIVDRGNMRQGMIGTAGRQVYPETSPQINNPVRSSRFQDFLMGPLVNYYMNTKWYIAYPAATVMNGGDHNLALSERVPQLPTRTSGGPGPGTMRQAPRFKAVQTIPRYSTMPPTYPTASANG